MKVYTGPANQYEHYHEIEEDVVNWDIIGDIHVQYWTDDTQLKTQTLWWRGTSGDLYCIRYGYIKPDGSKHAEVVWCYETPELVKYLTRHPSEVDQVNEMIDKLNGVKKMLRYGDTENAHRELKTIEEDIKRLYEE